MESPCFKTFSTEMADNIYNSVQKLSLMQDGSIYFQIQLWLEQFCILYLDFLGYKMLAHYTYQVVFFIIVVYQYSFG